MNTQTTTSSAPAERPGGNHVDGYKAVLVREETKAELRDLRCGLSDRDINLERRLATAALNIVIKDANASPEAMRRLVSEARQVLLKDLNAPC